MATADFPRWVQLDDKTWLHRTTIQTRVKKLGWSFEQSVTEPVNETLNADQKQSIAARARADGFTPGKVQSLMRENAITYEDAVSMLLELDPDDRRK